MTAVDWIRIDKMQHIGQVTSSTAVVRAAAGFFDDPQAAIASGRFSTPFAIYVRADRLEPTDPRPREPLHGAPPR